MLTFVRVMRSVLSLLLSALTLGAAAQPRGATALSMERQGLVDVLTVDSTLHVSLMYARADNFTGEVLYDDLRQAYLHPRAAAALAKAQRRLKELRPDLSLIIFDAARPMTIQRRMYDKVKGTPKYFYVSNPANGGGLHNYGMAVDLSICTAAGDTIAMGSLVDHMSDLSHTDNEAALVSRGRLTSEAVAHRQLLRRVMTYAGFTALRTEWWHFNLVSRATARRYYKVIE